MTRLVSALLVPLLTFGFVLALAPPAAADPCVTTSTGHTACGSAQYAACGTGAASGTADASVHWKLVVHTNHGDASDESTGLSATLHASAPCWTDTCGSATLYADDTVVDGTLTFC